MSMQGHKLKKYPVAGLINIILTNSTQMPELNYCFILALLLGLYEYWQI